MLWNRKFRILNSSNHGLRIHIRKVCWRDAGKSVLFNNKCENIIDCLHNIQVNHKQMYLSGETKQQKKRKNDFLYIEVWNKVMFLGKKSELECGQIETESNEQKQLRKVRNRERMNTLWENQRVKTLRNSNYETRLQLTRLIFSLVRKRGNLQRHQSVSKTPLVMLDSLITDLPTKTTSLRSISLA